WKLEYELSPENLYDGARFGHSLAADSGRVIVGAPDQQGYDELENAGSAYGFDLTRNPGEKPEASNINVSMPSSNEHFGHAVDIKGGWAIISTFESGMVVGPRNRVFLFDQSEVNGGWYRREYLTKSGDNWPQYGTDVAISRESALVGFPREQVDGSQVGGVYSFSGFQSSEGINEPEILTPAHPQGFMNYGSGVAVSSEILAVSSNDGVEIYNWLDNAWSRTAIFEPQIAGEISFTGRVAVNDHFVVASGVPNTEDGYNNPGIYWQRLDEVTSAQKKRQMTTGFELEKAYPNPFNPTTVIQYSLSNADYVRLEVFDLLGRKVDILADGIKPAGEHTAVFNGTQLTSGVYIYTIKVGNSIMTEKMTMIK
ncbi:MAG: T9SS type A sorting domain-containing protein, partial [Balneolales bacterium]